MLENRQILKDRYENEGKHFKMFKMFNSSCIKIRKVR